MKIKTLLVAVAALTLVFTACKKKDSSTPATTTASKTTLLTAHDWKFSDAGADLNGDNQVDNGGSLSDTCSSDDYDRYAANMVFTEFYGANASACGETTETGTWKLINSDASIVTSTDGGDTAKIEVLNDNSLVTSELLNGLKFITVYKK